MTQVQGVQVPVPPTGVDGQALVAAYAAAWNAHDGAAVAALVSGSYTDPTLPAPVAGPALAAMVDGLCAAFPDLQFEAVRTLVDATTVVFEWRMRGTNDGAALPGAPAPTGGTIDLPGVDVITTDGSRIVDVVGYFDQKSFVEQLGLQTFVLPTDEWPVTFGTGVRVDLGNTTAPGAMTMTWIDVAPDEVAELQRRSTEIVTALASDPGFLGFQSTTIGARNTTITLWTSPQAAEAAIARNTPHTSAMQRVERDGFGNRGYTSFWAPHRVNPQFVVCSCGARVVVEPGRSVTCACGAVLEAEPYL